MGGNRRYLLLTSAEFLPVFSKNNFMKKNRSILVEKIFYTEIGVKFLFRHDGSSNTPFKIATSHSYRTYDLRVCNFPNNSRVFSPLFSTGFRLLVSSFH